VVDRDELAMRLGAIIARFQDGTTAMDLAAAEVLALARDDLPLLTMILQDAGGSIDQLVERLAQPRAAVMATLARLERAGYAKREQSRVDLTDHARRWIGGIWGPLERDGATMISGYTAAELAAVASFTEAACALQEKHVARVRASLASGSPSSRASRHRRGGLSPAALRRIESFVEANLASDIDLAALADRARLSVFHFARAFKTTTGVTPRAFVEGRRVALAMRLLRDTDRSIAQVALESGFTSQSRLTTVFRRSTGETPARFRSSQRDDS
jgi:AraC family transcriptional regulator